jgi:arogenate/prephenate dehydratase
MVIAFQGEPGAYSELAAYEHFGPEINTLPCKDFEQVFKSVEDSSAEIGLIPIENSLAGSIHRNYDLLLRHNLQIVSEYHLRVSHCLLALPGVKLDDIISVHSHPQALAQCEASLAQLQVESVVESDTAGSARMLREQGLMHAAALASRRAAEVYNLNILAENMEDNPANYTRFLAISAKPNPPQVKSKQEYKTSIVFALPNNPGVLFKSISVFALREIDLTKIESRPLAGKPWEYMFYIDFAGHTASDQCERALSHLEEMATSLRVLGSYVRHRIPGNTVSNDHPVG